MLNKETIVRAWKDVEFRNSLTEEEQAMLPSHPAGLIELSDEQFDSVNGGTTACTSAGGYPCTNPPRTGWGTGTCGCATHGNGCGGSNPCMI